MGHLIILIASLYVGAAAASDSGLQPARQNLTPDISAIQNLTTDISEFKCYAEGRFNHPGGCGEYIECVRTEEGSFLRRFGSCHGGIFSEEDGHCVEHNEDLKCKRPLRTPRGIKSDLRRKNLCSKIQNGFVCANCKTVVKCVAGEAYSYTCGAGDMCGSRTEFGGAVCYPRQPQSCTCKDKLSFHVDAYNPQMFFFCKNMGDDPEMYHCTEGKRFDNKTNQCTNTLGLPHCIANGNFALHYNCSRYYTCIRGKDGWVQKNFTCSNGFMFNELTKNCEDPCSWKTKVITCQMEGRFPDPMSCQRYYECVKQEKGFRQYLHQCPMGTEWQGNAMVGYGHCVKNPANTCRPITINRCTIPKDRCPNTIPTSSTTTSKPSGLTQTPATTALATSSTTQRPTTTTTTPAPRPTSPAPTLAPIKPCHAPFTLVAGVGCIRYMRYEQTAGGARSDCFKQNADLYVADSLHELDIFWNYFNANFPSEAHSGMRLWFGIVNRRWFSGRQVTEWAAGEPRGNHHSCQFAAQRLRILEGPCSRRSYFMCERN